jgi:Na+-driven multidrug efflux pump
MLVNLIGVWLVRIPLSYFLAFPMGMGLVGVWLTIIIDWIIRSTLLYMFWLRGKWVKIKL